jgi:flagellar protein FlbD
VIRVTRLNGSVFFVNAEMVEFVEATPDTVMTLTDGTKLVVRESPDAIVKQILVYRQQTHQPVDLVGQ